MARPRLSHVTLVAALWLLFARLVLAAPPTAAVFAPPLTAEPTFTSIGKLGGGISSVAVRGNLAIVGDLQGLLVLDISDPAKPFLVSSLALGGEVTDIVLDGDLAYVANRRASLQVIDLANPFAPRLRGSLAVNGSPSGLDVVNGQAVIAAYNGGLQVASISNPDAPALLGKVALDVIRGSALDVRVVGNLAYLATLAGLEIYDLSDSANPTQLAFFNAIANGFGNGRDVDVVGDRAYLATGSSGLVVLDVSQPVSPRVVGSLDTPGYTLGVQVADDRAYLAEREGGFQLVDLSNRDQPTLLGNLHTPGPVQRLNVVGTRVFLANSGGGLSIVETAGAQPQSLGVFAVGGSSMELAASGDRVYIARMEGFMIADISTPARPRVLGTLGLSGIGYNIAVSGNIVYVSSDLRYDGTNNFRDEMVWIIDVSDPSQPRTLSSIRLNSTRIGDLAILGSTLYTATSGQGLLLIDVTDPAAPGVPQPAPSVPNLWVGTITLNGARAYLSTGEVLDVSTPATPTLLGTLSLPSSSVLGASGAVIYVLETIRLPPSLPPGEPDTRTTLKLFDASDLAAPRLLGSYSADPAKIANVTIDGQLAYVVTQGAMERSLDIVDISDPAQPTLVAQPVLGSAPEFLLSTSDFIFGGGYRQGLQIYTSQNRFVPRWTSAPGETALVSADGSVDLRFDAGSLDESTLVAQIERLTPNQASGAERAVARSFIVEARESGGATVNQAQRPYTLWVDVGAAQTAATTKTGIAYWDGASWVDLQPCTSCAPRAGRIAVQTDHFGELALVTDVSPSPSPEPPSPSPEPPSPSPEPPSPSPEPTPEPTSTWELYLPVMRR